MKHGLRSLTGVLLALLSCATTAQTVTVYQLQWPDITDYFYTASQSDRDVAQTYGYAYHGTAFNLMATQVPGTVPLMRFYKSYPQTDHFYTHDPAEREAVESYGWVYEGVVGYIYTSNATGRHALWRLSKFDPATSDLQHYYTIDSQMTNVLVSEGWSLDGVRGYTPPSTVFCSLYQGEEHPPVVLIDTFYPVAVTMKNTCGGLWTGSSIYLNRKQGTWKPSEIFVQRPVRMGELYRFQWNLKAPYCPAPGGLGYCNEEFFLWKMARVGAGEFMDSTPGSPMKVGFRDVDTTNYTGSIFSYPGYPSPVPYGQEVPATAPAPPSSPQY
jgi:hypothetical protein